MSWPAPPARTGFPYGGTVFDSVGLRTKMNQHWALQAFHLWGGQGRVARVATFLDGRTAGGTGAVYEELLFLREGS